MLCLCICAVSLCYNINTTTTVLQPVYRSACISQHLQLRTGGFCWCKVLLPSCPCCWQPVLSDEEDAGVLLNSVIYTLHTVSFCYWNRRHISDLWQRWSISYLHTHTHTQPLNGLLSWTTPVGRYQKKHLPTHTHPDHRTSCITLLNLFAFFSL